MSRKIIVMTTAFIAGVLLIAGLSACFSPFKGDEAVLTIHFGGGNNRRSAAGWPPINEDDNLIHPMKFGIILESDSGIIRDEKILNEGDSLSNANFTFTVTPGRWNVYIENYIGETFLYAAGTDIVDISAGQDNHITIEMEKKYYETGDTGPGGGKIFYVDFYGFTMTDTGKTAHYLEAAPSDVLGTFQFHPNYGNGIISANNGDTSDDLGTGMSNTMKILEILNDNSVTVSDSTAYAAYNYGPGWFLPSKTEIALMGEYETEYGSDIEKKLDLVSTEYYGSSSDDDSMYRWALNYSNGNSEWVVVSYQSSYPCSVRPIRAF